jgi:hypothetical protein
MSKTKMPIVLKIVDLVGRIPQQSFENARGKYISQVEDVDLPTEWKLTDDIRGAKEFQNIPLAMEFYRTQSQRAPLRDDGKPNRPLTAFSVMFEQN